MLRIKRVRQINCTFFERRMVSARKLAKYPLKLMIHIRTPVVKMICTAMKVLAMKMVWCGVERACYMWRIREHRPMWYRSMYRILRNHRLARCFGKTVKIFAHAYPESSWSLPLWCNYIPMPMVLSALKIRKLMTKSWRLRMYIGSGICISRGIRLCAVTAWQIIHS